MEKQNWIIAGFATLIAYINNWNATLLIIFLILMTIDMLIGIGKAILDGAFKSSLMRIGIVRKGIQLLLMMALLLFEIVLKAIEPPAKELETLIRVTAPVPPVMLLKVLLLDVFITFSPQVEAIPLKTVAPFTVIFSKVFPLIFSITEFVEV